MPKLITNPGQAFTAGATWGTLSGDDEMTQDVVHLLNGTGTTLYTGDIVCLDVTGTQAILSASAGDPAQIGTVGGAEQWGSYYPVGSSNINLATIGGGPVPNLLAPNVVANMGYTNGSPTVTYASAAAVDLGKQLIPAYNSSTDPTPQVLTITAVNVGVGYTVNANFNGTTGTFSTLLQLAPSAIGPGWLPTSIAPGAQCPIVRAGFGRVNINAVAATVAKDFISVGNATVVGARTANGAAVAGQIGQFIAVTLEAYAARDTTLTGLGIAGHDSVRARIGNF